MPLKTEAEVTVDADQLITMNLGFATVNEKGALVVRLPAHVAEAMEYYGAATVTTPADAT